MVQHRYSFCDTSRVVHGGGDVEYPRTDVDVGRLRKRISDERLGSGEMRVLLQEVMLGDPGILESCGVGRLDVLDLVEKPTVLGICAVLLADLRWHADAVEDAELHGGSFRPPGGYQPIPKSATCSIIE